jgi:DNA-directed RNA polymerase specialized sigma24 family protein
LLHSDERLADFEAERPRLLRLGYRMLGSLSEAEDILQEAWLRWAATVQWTCNGFAPVTYLIMPPWLRTRVG